MEYKTIWSSTGTSDKLSGLPEEDKRNFLMEIGFDDEMLDGADLDDVINDDIFGMEDEDIFYNEIRPMLEKDTAYGILLGASLDDDEVVGFRVDEILQNDTGGKVELLEDENGDVVISAYGHMYKLFIIPERSTGKQAEFIRNTMPEFEKTVSYDFGEEDRPLEDFADDYLSDEEWVANWVDHDKLLEFGTPVKNTLATVKESLTEAKAKQPEELEIELADLEADLEDFGPDGLYAVSLDRFSRQYPEFTTYVIKTFLKEMQILTKEELEDMSTLDDYWRNGELILDNDWDCLIEGAHKLANGESVQWEKLYKKYYRPTDSE